MADFIQQAAVKDQAQEGSPTDFLSPNETAEIGNKAGASVAQQPPPPQGMPVGAGHGATQEDPVSAPEEQATEQEQAEYDDLFQRAMALINDTRAQGEEQSPADALIKLMSQKDKAAHEAIGTAAGMTLQTLMDISKRNGVQYSGPVLQEVAMDCVEELGEIAKLSGAVKDMPEEDSEEWAKLMELSALEMSKYVGEWMLQTGQADQQGHMQELEGQMQREADAGELDDWGMEELDPEMRAQVVGSIQDGQGRGMAAPVRQPKGAA